MLKILCLKDIFNAEMSADDGAADCARKMFLSENYLPLILLLAGP